jgi:hypothetical protein
LDRFSHRVCWIHFHTNQNLYGANVNQELITGIMDGMVDKKRSVDGVPTSLCDLGYCDVGLVSLCAWFLIFDLLLDSADKATTL